jgi:hypothetical protein
VQPFVGDLACRSAVAFASIFFAGLAFENLFAGIALDNGPIMLAGCTRQTAESYIEIHDAFFHIGNVLPTWKLPQSFRGLYALAKLKLSGDQLQASVLGLAPINTLFNPQQGRQPRDLSGYAPGLVL